MATQQEDHRENQNGSGMLEALVLKSGMNYRERLGILLAKKSLVRGRVTLASGLESSYYFDCKLTTLDPEGAVLTGYSILEFLDEHDIVADAIGGLTMGADPIVTSVVAMSHLAGKPLPGFLIRRQRKGHGREKLIEGYEGHEGAKVVIVDEVCTTGGSIIEAIQAAEEQRIEVVAIVSLVDREEGGSEKLREKYNYFSIFTAKELLREDVRAAAEDHQTSKTPSPTTSIHN